MKACLKWLNKYLNARTQHVPQDLQSTGTINKRVEERPWLVRLRRVFAISDFPLKRERVVGDISADRRVYLTSATI
jgi:hypothetical protein